MWKSLFKLIHTSYISILVIFHMLIIIKSDINLKLYPYLVFKAAWQSLYTQYYVLTVL